MAPDYATITWSAEGAIGRLTLARPDKRNPIGPATCGELVRALAAAAADPAIRVVVLTGAGSVFSAGGDLAQMSGMAAEGAVAPASLVDLFTAMHGLGKPIIAMVNGHALAGGLGLVVASDLAVASQEATFGTTEIRVGLWPMMVSAELARSIGRKHALDLMVTGRRIDAAEALAMGLVNRVVPAASLEAETMAMAAELAELSPATMSLGLRAFYQAEDMELGPALRYLEEQLAAVLQLDDAREGLTAFLQKRKPVWTGR